MPGRSTSSSKFCCSTSQSATAGLPPRRISLSNTRHLYWTIAQLVAHHSINGCNLQPGDLFGSGTISAPVPEGLGSLLEITEGGRRPLDAGDGQTRRFLLDGDEVIMRAHARRDGRVPIGLGEVRGRVVPAELRDA